VAVDAVERVGVAGIEGLQQPAHRLAHRSLILRWQGVEARDVDVGHGFLP
jgi:hypothetical protein